MTTKTKKKTATEYEPVGTMPKKGDFVVWTGATVLDIPCLNERLDSYRRPHKVLAVTAAVECQATSTDTIDQIVEGRLYYEKALFETENRVLKRKTATKTATKKKGSK